MKTRNLFLKFLPKKNKTHSSATGEERFRHFLTRGIALSSVFFFSSLTITAFPDLPEQAVFEIRQGISAIQSGLEKLKYSPSETVTVSELDPSDHQLIAGSGVEQNNDQVPDIITGTVSEQYSIYDTVLSTSLGSMTYYNQGDIRWRDYLYGGADPMCTHGCGPTVIAMLVHSFSPHQSFEEAVTPIDMANWAYEHGHYAPQKGSYRSLIPNALSSFGLTVTSVRDRSPANVSALLNSGHVLVALMGPGSLTENGHFIIITHLAEDGTVSIADPNSLENSEKNWDLDLLMNELKNVSDSGAPLWAVSR